MSMENDDWSSEQERLREVFQELDKKIPTLEQQVGTVRDEVVDTRRGFWDEVTVNLGSTDDIVETHIAIRQQAEVLADRERRLESAQTQLKKLRKLRLSPYFGRIDFQEEGYSDTEVVYIGLASFRDDEGTFLVYDWRAPISSLYYDHGPGPASYEAPAGVVHGTMTLKRQFVIKNGKLELMFDASETIGDELLMEALGRHSDAQMKSIVATIQREQNLIIRDDVSRMLVVQGAAGSGKTSAALQRVAYLLYKHRATLQPSQMVLFSPNPLFMSYVSTVLPELGERNMSQTTFQEYLEKRLSREFDVEDPFTQLEYLLTETDESALDTRIAGIRYKSSIEFMDVLTRYRDHLEHQDIIFTSVRFQKRLIVSSEQIKEQFYGYDSSIRLLTRMDMLRKWVLAQIEAFEELEIREPWVEEEVQLLDLDDYQGAYNELRRQQKKSGTTFNDFAKETEILSRMVVRRRLKPVRNRVKRLGFINVKAMYLALFTNRHLLNKLCDQRIPEHWDAVSLQTSASLQQSQLFYEDATPYLYLKDLLQGIRRNTSVRYVILDEAQDYSPFQFEFIKRLFPWARMTALGDLNQAIYAHGSDLRESQTMENLYGKEHTRFLVLVRSYRSTYEIVQFTCNMIPGGDQIVPFERHGDKPTVQQVDSESALHEAIEKDVEALKHEGYELIAVICKTAAESAEAYEALRHVPTIRLVSKETENFTKGVVVIPSYLAKGVEFDAVIVYNGSNQVYSRERERNLFYTACTRAMHALHIFSLGEPNRFIQEQVTSTYTLA